MENLSDKEVMEKGMQLLFQELGEMNAQRFLTLIRHEMTLQEPLFKDMDIDDIYERAIL